MIDPSTDGSQPLNLGAAPMLAPQREEAAPGVPNIAKERTETRLAEEFDLVRVHVPVYIQDRKAAAARSAGAERVAKHRQKLASEGLRPAAVPAAVLDQVKAAGGWDQWQAQKAAATVPPVPIIVEKIVEKLVEIPGPERLIEKRVEVQVPAQLSTSDKAALSLGKAAQKLTGWRRALLVFAIGAAPGIN